MTFLLFIFELKENTENTENSSVAEKYHFWYKYHFLPVSVYLFI